MTPPRGLRRPVFGITTIVGALVTCGVASAYWSTSGAGVAAAGTTTLAAPTAVTGTPSLGAVTVSFTGVAAPTGAVDGYVVTRYQGVTPSNACGTDPALPGTWLSAAATGCVDNGLSAGTYTYRVTAMFRTWSAQSAPSANVVVVSDATAPTQTISVVSGPAHIAGGNLYWRSATAGSFVLRSTLTDAGSGPASAQFPTTGGGVTHANEVVAHQSGPLPTRTYDSSPFTWNAGAANPAGTYTVTGRDVANNAVSTNLTFVKDDTGPTGGALTVNGTAGTGGGSTSSSTTGTFTGSFTHYAADAGSGFVSSTLTREAGAFTAGSCGSWASPTTIGSISETTAATGCYRYRLTGTDRVGNTSVLTTVVRVDRTAPTFDAITAVPGGGSVAWFDNGSSTLYYANSPAGSFRLQATLTDDASGPESVRFPQANNGILCGWLACFTHADETVTDTAGPPTIDYLSSDYAWGNNANYPSGAETRTLTGTDVFGNTTTLVFTVVNDEAAPTGGALTVNGTAATGGGSTSSTTGTSWTIGARTDWTDAGAGIASSVLVRESAIYNGTTCGTFGGATTITGTPAQNGMSLNTCYRYTLTGTDNLGNTSSVSTTVRAAAAPVGPTVTSVHLVDGAGNPGQMDNDDQIIITFSEQMSVSSFCGNWTNNNTDKDINGNNQVQVTLYNGNAQNDYIELTTNTCGGGGFRFGRITLGSTAHIQNNPSTTFGGTGGNRSRIQWDASANRMTITLGEGSVGPGTPSNDIGIDTVATYTPDAAIRSSANVAVVGVGTTANTEHF